eukprot:3098851-Rhodomonas_salina.1
MACQCRASHRTSAGGQPRREAVDNSVRTFSSFPSAQASSRHAGICGTERQMREKLLSVTCGKGEEGVRCRARGKGRRERVLRKSAGSKERGKVFCESAIVLPLLLP